MSTLQDILDTAKGAGIAEVEKLVRGGRSSFAAAFAGFVSAGDLERLLDLFDQATAAKFAMMFSVDSDELDDLTDRYGTYMQSIETLADRYIIVGQAKFGVIVRSFAHQVISGFATVAGAVLQAVLVSIIPGIGGIVGAGANVGLRSLVEHFLR